MTDARSSHHAGRVSLPWKGIAAALLVGACSLGPALEAPAPSEPAGEPNYRKLILDGVPSLLSGMPPWTVMEVSALRRSLPVQPGDWTACLRRTAETETTLFAVFFKSQRIDSVRRALLVDKCENESYAPLAKAPPGKAK